VRKHRRGLQLDPFERYREEVWRARAEGEIDAEEALELIIWPRPRIVALFAEAVA
jgi:hypothetical protein